MINCSICGTQNRDGSKFCSNCGGRLAPPSGLICPMCGTPNKMESVFCSNCGARLVPLIATPPAEKPPPPATPIKGLSLPSKDYEPTVEPTEETDAAQSEDWLARLRETPAEEAEPEEDLPDWLKPAKSAETIAPVAEDEQPAWLRELRAEAKPIEEPAADEVSIEELPDWLKAPAQLEQPAEPQAEEAPPAISSEPEPTPSFESENVTSPEGEPASTPPIAEAEMPDWLKALGPQTEIEPEPEIPTTPTEPAIESVTPVSETEMPAWVKEFKPQPVDAQETTPGESLLESIEAEMPTEPAAHPAPSAGTQVPVSNIEGVEEIPDWLQTPSFAPSAEAEAEAAMAEIQPALPDEVPDWIAALKPAEPTLEEEPLETSGPLEGLRGVLPLALSIAEPHPSIKLASPAGRTETGKLFEAILAEPAIATSAPVAKKSRINWSMRPLVYLLLALAVIVPFFLPSDWASSFLPINGTPTSEFYDTLQALPANSTVLMAFEYDPSTAGEMDLQAKAIARHLIQRNLKIIALSTLETGAPIARRVLDDVTRGVSNYAYGTNFVNLGFLPGHESGLSNLATSGFAATTKDVVLNREINQINVTANVKTLRDLSLVIVLAGSDETLQAWMEQVQPRAGVPIIAGVSAAVEPKARVYRDTPTRQLRAVMSGLVGAAQYEALSNQSGLALISVNAQTIAQLVLVLIVVLGNLVFWIQKARGTEAK